MSGVPNPPPRRRLLQTQRLSLAPARVRHLPHGQQGEKIRLVLVGIRPAPQCGLAPLVDAHTRVMAGGEIVCAERTRLVETGDRQKLADLEKRCLENNARFKTWECTDSLMARTNGALYLHCLPAEDFPQLPDAKVEMGTIPSSALRAGLKRVLIAASNDQSRPALCAVQLAKLKDQVYLAAADGARGPRPSSTRSIRYGKNGFDDIRASASAPTTSAPRRANSS